MVVMVVLLKNTRIAKFVCLKIFVILMALSKIVKKEKEKMTTEEFRETVCDEICQYPWEASCQEDLNNICEDCILNRVKKVELEVGIK